MKINQHNLNIAKYCAPEPQKAADGVTRITNALKFTGAHTVASNNHFMAVVSAVEPSAPELTYVSQSNAEMMKTLGGDQPFDPAALIFETVTGEGWNEKLVTDPTENTPPAFEMFIDASYLREMAQAAIDFGSRGVRIRFYSPNCPIRLDARRLNDPQELTIYVAALNPSENYAKGFGK